MPLCFAAARNDEVLAIDVFDVIGESWYGGISADAVRRALDANADAKRILVRINSPGGDVFDGTAIYNLLRQHKGHVSVQILGLAASMASVIALAGDTVEMAENAMFMIHDPWLVAIGSGDDMRHAGEMLDKVKDTLLTAYEKNSNLERDEIAALMSAETWMTAAEAKERGFIDAIIPIADEDDQPDDAKARAMAVVDKFRRAPSGVCGRYMPRIAAVATQEAPRRETIMDREKIIALLGLPKDATDEQIEAALRPGEKPAVNLSEFVPRADYEAMRVRLAEREKAEKEAQAKAFEAKVDAAIKSAVTAGKLPPVSADFHRSACLRGGDEALTEFLAYVDKAPEIAGSSQMERAEARNLDGNVSSDPQVKAICKSLGIDPADFAAAQADIRDNPDHYPTEAYRFAI